MANPGRKPVVETDAFHDAVDAAVEAKLAAFKIELLSGIGTAAPAEPSSAQPASAADLLGDVLSKLSMNLQSLNQQGQRNKPLTPEEVLKRELAVKRMVDLLAASREPGAERPAYKLIAPTSLNERWIPPYRQLPDKRTVNNEVTWTGVPNDAMVPINPAAEAIFAAWRESTGGPASLVPTADVRPFYVTAAGLTVKGDPPKRRHVASEPDFRDDLGFANGDPNAPEVAVLGTIAPKAKQNNVGGVQIAPGDQ